MTLRKQIAALLPLVFAAGAAGAQGLKSGPYELPYKNTYVKEVFVAENEFRTAKPETIKPRSFAEARKILPAPVWEGHDKEIEMYWHAWRIALGELQIAGKKRLAVRELLLGWRDVQQCRFRE